MIGEREHPLRTHDFSHLYRNSFSEETNWLLIEAKTGTSGAGCEKSMLTATSRSKLLKDVSDTYCVAYGTVLHLSLLHFTCQLKRA